MSDKKRKGTHCSGTIDTKISVHCEYKAWYASIDDKLFLSLITSKYRMENQSEFFEVNHRIKINKLLW